ncbi:vWA domain-containing protein [Sabulicella glaciei]|uniref:VWA domain-containing protein n=1 Tax=Sabulicella glaciei TaxID=2984948 RepID=A0ABT3NYM2_9PROT|nr:VWA domain-containing protein [Roseococcus sp. MDT2-1-1]MCW8087226.1 VWA domain-containing protein [Roseococcus sp. MDT2-1-1]
MFASFLLKLRAAGLPCSLTEWLALVGATKAGVAEYNVEDFYFLARATLVKDERHMDRFDRVFSEHFKGVLPETTITGELITRDLPEEWLRKLAEKMLSDEEREAIERAGGFQALMDLLRQRLEEQKKRHQGGSRMIGTAGTSPFGAYGDNPEGVRIGQEGGRRRSAVKVWDKREFRDLADDAELGTRAMKLALRRLRRFARQGEADELDMAGTIGATARNAGTLDLRMQPPRRNAVKVLLLLDIGGSMDDHIRASEELFSAARSEFKHLVHLYFHNCPYERLWKTNARRSENLIRTEEVLRTYGPDWRVVFVGDASMSPYELVEPGGSVEHWNEEAGEVWLRRICAHFRRVGWINPVPEGHWSYTRTVMLINRILEDRMFPMTLDGLDRMAKALR